MQRIQAMASMAPSCLVLSSIAPNQGSTCSRNTFMVSIVAILLSMPTQRAAMWRTAVYGCCRQVHRRGSCSINCRYRDNRRLAVIDIVHVFWCKMLLKVVRVCVCARVRVYTYYRDELLGHGSCCDLQHLQRVHKLLSNRVSLLQQLAGICNKHGQSEKLEKCLSTNIHLNYKELFTQIISHFTQSPLKHYQIPEHSAHSSVGRSWTPTDMAMFLSTPDQNAWQLSSSRTLPLFSG